MISDKGADFIIDRLNSFGYEAYYVGGCVRNYLLNVPIIDYDLTTNALPNTIIDVFSDCKDISDFLDKFMDYCHIINKPIIEEDLFI